MFSRKLAALWLAAASGLPALQFGRTAVIFGKIVIEGGGAPRDPVLIEAVCGDQARSRVYRASAYTDAQGTFSIRITMEKSGPGDDPGGIADSNTADQYCAPGCVGGRETSDPAASPGLAGCQLRTTLAGYRPAKIDLPGGEALNNADAGAIILHSGAKPAPGAVSVLSLSVPPKAERAYRRGQAALAKRSIEAAFKAFREAVTLYPRYAAAWCGLGNIEEVRRHLGDARASYEHAREADPRDTQAHLRLAWISMQEQKWAEAATLASQAILTRADMPEAFLFHSLASLNTGDIEAAEKSAREAKVLDPQHRYPKANYLLGMALAREGKPAAAAEELRNYLRYAPGAGDAEAVRRQIEALVQAGPGGP